MQRSTTANALAEKCRPLLFCILLLGSANVAWAVDHVTFRRDGKEMKVAGRLVVMAQDGGLLLLARDGTLWAIPPEQLVAHTSDDVAFAPLSREVVADRLLAELPAGFSVHYTANYVILYDTSRAYAQWCGGLFERLYRAFNNYWSRRGFKLTEPEFPMVAIVFADRAAYAKFARDELGNAVGSVVGYFSLRTNRMTMYDLTGVEMQSHHTGTRGLSAQIDRILAQPDAVRTVATIVHEATHQIAFNCGLHQRYSDCPVWFSEGIAVYFETPDLRNSKGWRGIGKLNASRMDQFAIYFARRPANALETLVANDQRFRNTKQSLNAYAEAWALTYFLIRQRPKQYIAYLKVLSEKSPLVYDGPETRLEEFRAAFGDLDKLDTEFIRYMRRIR